MYVCILCTVCINITQISKEYIYMMYSLLICVIITAAIALTIVSVKKNKPCIKIILCKYHSADLWHFYEEDYTLRISSCAFGHFCTVWIYF